MSDISHPPTPHSSHIEHRGGLRATHARSAEDVLSEINGLRQSGNLGLHMAEDDPRYAFPAFSYDHLSELAGKDIEQTLAAHTPRGGQTDFPIMSISLLPPHDTIKPYYTDARIGYLLDLSQNKENSPLIIALSNVNISSGDSPYRKSFDKYGQVTSDSFLSGTKLDAEVIADDEPPYTKRNFYSTIIHDSGVKGFDGLIIAIGKNPEYSNTQHHALLEHYKKNHAKRAKNPYSHNELLTALSTDHVTALMVDCRTSPDTRNDAQETLIGTIAGLQHLQHAEGHMRHLPVVKYHIDPERAGTFSYIGCGAKELLEASLSALRTIDTTPYNDEGKTGLPRDMEHANLHATCKRLFGYDAWAKPDIRAQQLDALEDRIRSGAEVERWERGTGARGR